MFVGKCRLYLWESKQQERLLKQVRMCGAEDRTRTDTGFLPADFKSAASANSATPAMVHSSSEKCYV